MVGEESGAVFVETAVERGAHDELLQQAVSILRMRHEQGWYGMSETAVTGLSDTLSEIAAAHDVDGSDRKEAIALAHRLIDNDNPEQSPMWPRPAG